jgi:hypothetical protein
MAATFRFPNARESFPFQWLWMKSLNSKPTYDVSLARGCNLVAWRLCALRIIETFDDTISLQSGEPIGPKDPIELIDLVLETYGGQTIGLFDLFHTAQILAAHPHTGMAFDLFRYARHGDAAFFVPDHVGGSPDDLRVDVGPHSIRCCEFDHDQPLQNADMSGGDSDCRCRTQRVQEIGRKQAKVLVKYDDALGRRAKGDDREIAGSSAPRRHIFHIA